MDKAFMELFSIDPIERMHSDEVWFEEFDFEDGDLFMRRVVQEASEIKSEGFFSRVISVIKKVIQWIAQRLKDLVNFITGLFTKNKKTADQVAEETLPTPTSSQHATNKSASAKETLKLSDPSQHDPAKLISKVSFTYVDDDNNQHNETIEAAYKELIYKIQGEEIEITFGEGFPDKNSKVPSPPKLGNAVARTTPILKILSNPKALEHFSNMIVYMKDQKWNDAMNAQNKFDKEIYSYNGKGVISYGEVFRFSAAQLMDVSTKINELSDVIKSMDDAFNNINKDNQNSDTIKEFMKDVYNTVINLQFGLNLISREMRGVHMVDAKYEKIINNEEELSKFAEGLVNAGTPSKYVAYNVFFVCNEELRGNADVMKPKMGQTRLALFPYKQKHVTKIALNHYGMRSNKIESNIYQYFNQRQAGQHLAPVVFISKNNYVENMGKCDSIGAKPSMIDELKNKLKALIKQIKYPQDFTIDLHPGNVGSYNGRLVAIDYGLV